MVILFNSRSFAPTPNKMVRINFSLNIFIAIIKWAFLVSVLNKSFYIRFSTRIRHEKSLGAPSDSCIHLNFQYIQVKKTFNTVYYNSQKKRVSKRLHSTSLFKI